MPDTHSSKDATSEMARAWVARIRAAVVEYNAAVAFAESKGIRVDICSAGGADSGRIEIRSITLITKL